MSNLHRLESRAPAPHKSRLLRSLDVRNSLVARVARGVVLATVLTSPATGLSDPPAPGVALAVTKAWSRATAPGTTVGVVYFEITNAGGEDELLTIDTPLARRVEMHSSQTIEGVMRMRRVDSVPIAAAGHVVFRPGGLHAMLLDLMQPLRERDHFQLTLVFRHAGRLQVDVVAGSIGALGPPAADTSGHQPVR